MPILPPLPRSQRRRIHKIIHTTRDKEHARRLMAILLLHEGRSIADVHLLTGAARSTIGRWLNWYRHEGVDGLISLPAGRAGDAKGRAGALEEDIGVSPSLVGRNCDVAVQTVDSVQNQSARIQLSGRRSDGVCECDKQTEYPWSACKKAPSVVVTWGCRSHGLRADLGIDGRPRLPS